MRDAVAGDGRLGLLERALRVMRDVVAELAPDDGDLPTPCAEYDVRRLLEHVIGWQRVFAACAAGEEPPLHDGSPTYRASADLAGDLGRASATLVSCLRNRRDRAITLPYRGDTSVDLLVDELLAETVIHAWDLATGLGRTVEFDDDTVAAAHVGLSKLLGESFARTAFRAPQQMAAAAEQGELERLLARSGRTVDGA
jgi:uncharacterized protein (TIGR03086 family)